MTNTVNIEIDGKKIVAAQGSMIIEAADNNDVYIPRFCYHKKLSIAANCRMCLVELEGVKKPMPACATPINEGMKIRTRSELARKSQKAVMEFLLINHPLDCPICDQGGQCELQDLSMGYGSDASRYESSKRVVKDKDLGPLVSTEMTRCINCTRCVRFTQEIAGDQELGTMGRGEHVEISTFVERAVRSEISGNIIDLCPVGALTSKPFRFTARAWELQQRPSIAAHDCLGSNINVHTLANQVKRVVPKDNEAVNEAWLSDRDRFSYVGVNSEQRLAKPLLKKDGVWQEVDWTVALEIVASSLENVKNQVGADKIGALISPNSTVEEHYLLQKLLREFGSNNIDHRLQACDFRDQNDLPAFPQLGLPIADLEQLDVALLIGSDVQREQPLAAARLLKATRNGGQVIAINPYDFDFHFASKTKVIAAPEKMCRSLAGIAKVLSTGKSISAAAQALLKDAVVGETETAIAAILSAGEHNAIILGALALNSAQASELRFYATLIAQLCKATVGELTPGANAAGAWLAGAVPHRSATHTMLPLAGLNAQQMFAEPLSAYCLFNLEPEFDLANPALALQRLAAADFVVVCSPFVTDTMRHYADVILPITPLTETSGTLVNCNGVWQAFNAAVKPYGEARPGWKVLRVLANFLDLPNFEYASVDAVKLEVEQMSASSAAPTTYAYVPQMRVLSSGLARIAYWPMYRADNVVRRSQPLQDMIRDKTVTVQMNSEVAAQLNVSAGDHVQVVQGEMYKVLPVMIDERVANGCVQIVAALSARDVLGAAFGAVEIEKVTSW